MVSLIKKGKRSRITYKILSKDKEEEKKEEMEEKEGEVKEKNMGGIIIVFQD